MSAAQSVVDGATAATPGDASTISGLHPGRSSTRARPGHADARPGSRCGAVRGHLGLHVVDRGVGQGARPAARAEELTAQLNRVFQALIDELHRFGGHVIYFSGDAITCWIDGDDGMRATACALAMQATMDQAES